MHSLERVFKAAGDPTRTRILKLLQGGGLCVCQVQAVLGLAASTVSRHLTILKAAGLVRDRRDGKWIEYALASGAVDPHARAVLGMLKHSLERDAVVRADRVRLREVKAIPLDEVCALTPIRFASARTQSRRVNRKERPVA